MSGQQNLQSQQTQNQQQQQQSSGTSPSSCFCGQLHPNSNLFGGCHSTTRLAQNQSLLLTNPSISSNGSTLFQINSNPQLQQQQQQNVQQNSTKLFSNLNQNSSSQPFQLQSQPISSQPQQQTLFQQAFQLPTQQQQQQPLFQQPLQQQQQPLQFLNKDDQIQHLQTTVTQLQTRVQQLEDNIKYTNNTQEQRIKELEDTMKIMARLCSVNFKGLCNNGHVLEYTNQQDIISNCSCDVCKISFKDLQIGTYRCKLCDFDRCEICYNSCRLVQ